MQTFERTQIHSCQSDAELRQQKYKHTQSGTLEKKCIAEDIPFIPYNNHSDNESNHFSELFANKEMSILPLFGETFREKLLCH